MKLRDLALFCLFAICIGGASAPGVATGQEPSEELARIRQELQRIREQYRRQRQREHTLLDELAALDREVDLTRKLVARLSAAADKQRRRIREAQRQIAKLEREVARLQDAYAKRVVALYKYGRVRDLELLARGISLHKVLVWLKFEKLLAERDQRLYQRLKEATTKLERQKKLLELQLADQTKVLREKEKEEKQLLERRQERAAILERVQREEALYQRRIEELQLAEQELRRLIGRDVDRRRGASSEERDSGMADFASLRGRLPWPVRGEIIRGFGPYRHPKFRTVTENLGVDIRAPMGTPVRAVCDGRVTAITWQRARGNIVLLSHRDGYYTVYTHLADIYVTVDERVSGGDVIGTVGDTGSLEGPKLHFEIWHNTENLNPEDWLSE